LLFGTLAQIQSIQSMYTLTSMIYTRLVSNSTLTKTLYQTMELNKDTQPTYNN
jgi:hypothetical protein